ncbi:thiolase domain-containing protein [Candidatus Peregrinibacteria bacterium]|nr:thiolase domain-containing protein [Candidatus Peregrinibacteria bacterium]
MNADVFLIGGGLTSFGEHWNKNIRTLMDEAMSSAINAASITALDIDVIVVANMLGNLINNQSHLGALASSLLPHKPPALRVEAACASGSMAIHTACALLESGKAKTALVIGVEKMTDSDADTISHALMGAADEEHDQSCALTFPGIFGLIAQRYMYEYGLTRDELSLVSATHHRNALDNPFAQFHTEISTDDVSDSAPVADPLRLLDCSPISDGAAACILSVSETLSQSKGSCIRIAASQIANDTLSITERPVLTSFSATKDAMERALTEAAISREEIQCIELHDCFSIAALLNLEDMGFADPGKGISFYQQSSLPINKSGGLKACGHPVSATGIKQIIDTAKYLKTENRQWGLAQNFGGVGATCGIHILERTV